MEEQKSLNTQAVTSQQKAKRGPGRPTIGDKPLTSAERMKRSREKNKANTPNTPKGRREAEAEAAYLALKAEDFERAETLRLERELVEDIIYGVNELKDGVGDGGDYAYLDDLIDQYLTKAEREHELHVGGWNVVEKFERFYFDLIATEVGRAVLTHLGIELPPELPKGWRHIWIHGEPEGGGSWYVARDPYCWPRLAFSEYTGNESLLVWAHRWDRYNPPPTPENSQVLNGRPREEDASIAAQSVSWHLAEAERKRLAHKDRMAKLKTRYREARGKQDNTGLQAAPKNDPAPTPQAVESPMEPSLNSGQ
jgi:hypothetical protein